MSNRLVPQPEPATRYLRLLAETPARLADLAKSTRDDVLSNSPGPRSWSAVQILAHVWGFSDVWTFSTLAMLAEDEPQLALFDPRRWARAVGYVRLPFQVSLGGLAVSRRELVRALQDQSLSVWARRGMIRGRAHSVYSRTRRMAEHELEHLKQLRGLLAAKG